VILQNCFYTKRTFSECCQHETSLSASVQSFCTSLANQNLIADYDTMLQFKELLSNDDEVRGLFTSLRCLHCMYSFKRRVLCFSMQVVVSKCFLLNPEKICRRFVLSFLRKTHTLTPKMTSPSRRLGYSNNQLKSC